MSSMELDLRPTPEELLDRARAEATGRTRGKLRIGNTYAMQ